MVVTGFRSRLAMYPFSFAFVTDTLVVRNSPFLDITESCAHELWPICSYFKDLG